MKRYSHLATQTVFDELERQGRSQRWLTARLREELPTLNIWEPRLSDWKAGRVEMPDDVVPCAFRLLGLPESVLSLFVEMSLESDDMSPVAVTERVA